VKKIMGVILISSLLLLVGTSSYAQASGVDTNSIDIFLQEKMREGGLPCLSLGIVKDGETLYYKTYGDKYSRNAGDSELIFPIGSISKTFTALAIRQLINRAELKENAPVNDYLPGFTTMYQGNEATVTIGQLITHTSGISKLTGGAPYTYNTFYSLEKVVEKSMNITLAHSPGERYEYSNMNYILLGRILEIITGQVIVSIFVSTLLSLLE
jgi:CubicO group peptidase (beta-lactamase class C family)